MGIINSGLFYRISRLRILAPHLVKSYYLCLMKKAAVKKFSAKWWACWASVFSFARLVAFVAGMVTPPGIVILAAVIIVGTIIGFGIAEVIEIANLPKA